MEKNEVEKLFFLTSFGEKGAYNQLLKQFVDEGLKIAQTILNNHKYYSLKAEDFADAIIGMFTNALGTYKPYKSSFKTYSQYIIGRRLNRVIMDDVIAASNGVISLDYGGEEDRIMVEEIEDPNINPLPNQIAVEHFKHEMSSPKGYENKFGKLCRKINILLYAGYEKTEICKMLNITISQYRYAQKLTHNGEKMMNLKLELK